MICKHCGAAVQEDTRFCPICGTRLEEETTGYGNSSRPGSSFERGYQQYQQGDYRRGHGGKNGGDYDRDNFFFSLSHPEEQWDQDMYQEAYQFMAENQGYYGRKFQKLQAVRGTTDWNWCSFLFGGIWAFYRKMYVVGLIYLVGISILACIPVLGWAFSIAASVCFGVWGNYIYMKHVQTSVCKYTRYPLREKNLCYQSKGGVSVGAVFGAIGINILLAAVPSVLAGTLFGTLFFF